MLLLWSGRTRTLAGKAVISISFATRDRKRAQQRWTEVHPQVDALVQLAEVLSRRCAETKQASEVPRVDPARIRAVAEQTYHDVLACDDRVRIEGGFSTPTAVALVEATHQVGKHCADIGIKAELKARHRAEAAQKPSG